MPSRVRIGRQNLLPVFTIRLTLSRDLESEELTKIAQNIESEVQNRFLSYFGREKQELNKDSLRLHNDLVVVVEIGSLRVKICVGIISLSLALSSCSQSAKNIISRNRELKFQHASVDRRRVVQFPTPRIESDLRRFFKDTSSKINHIVSSNVEVEKQSPKHSLGAIVRIDALLRLYELKRITRDKCTKELEEVFKRIADVKGSKQLASSLTQYLETRYGKLFDYDKLRQQLPTSKASTELCTPTRVKILTIRVVLSNQCDNTEINRCVKLVQDTVSHAIYGKDTIVGFTVDDSNGNKNVSIWLLAGIAVFLTFLISKYGSLRQGLDYIIKDIHTLKKTIPNTLESNGVKLRSNSEVITEGNTALSRLQCFLSNIGEANLSQEQLVSNAENAANEIENNGERQAFRHLINQYLTIKYPKDKE